MQIVRKNITDLVFDPINARKHPVKNIDAIKGSLTKFGQQKPIVISSKGIVIAGNGTLMAAKDLGWKSIDCVVSELDDINQMAFALADNRTSELAEWDKEILEQQLAQLELNDFDIDDIGFEDFEIEKHDSNGGLIDPDEVPEISKNAFGVKRGDIWLLGNHRLMCGDSTSEDDVKKLMNGKTAEILFTSPPYSDLRDYNGKIDLSPEKLSKFLAYPAKTYFVNLGLQIKDREINCYWDEYINQAKSRKLKLLAWLVWDKGNASAPAHQQAMFGLSHEWIFVFGEYKKQNLIKENKGVESWGKKTTREKDGSLKESTSGEKRTKRQLDSIIQQSKAVTSFSGLNHPAQFPVGLPEMFILSSTNSGDIVSEPFCGSGSTLIACEKTGRTCYGMEIDENYCSVIIKRFQDFSGKQAVREG